MKDQGLKLGRSARTGGFVLTSKRGEKISAVEGLRPSPRMMDMLKQTSAQSMSGDERRALVLEMLRKE